MGRPQNDGIAEGERGGNEDDAAFRPAASRIDYDYRCSCYDEYVTRKGGSAMLKNKQGMITVEAMEMIQVAMLIAIAVVVGLVFKSEVSDFVNNVFTKLGKWG